EQEHLAGREVDLGEHEQHHLADCDRPDRPCITGRRAEAELAGERRAGPDREVHEQRDRDEDRGELALVEEEVKDAARDRGSFTPLPRRAGRRGSGRRWSARLHAREDQCGIDAGGLRTSCFDAVPSNLFFARYGPTVDWTTMPRPVSVFVAFINPPEMLNRNSCMIVSKPCR